MVNTVNFKLMDFHNLCRTPNFGGYFPPLKILNKIKICQNIELPSKPVKTDLVIIYCVFHGSLHI